MGEALSLLLGRPSVPKHFSFLSFDSRKRRVSLTPRKASQQLAMGFRTLLSSTLLQMNSWADWVCTSPWIPSLLPLEALCLELYNLNQRD